MLFVDDLGWSDLGYQNSEFETPNIDKLKHDGLYFSRTYVSTATSSPSRASLLTGKEALRCGFVRHIYDNPDREEFQTMAKDPGHMKSRGWLPLDEITYGIWDMSHIILFIRDLMLCMVHVNMDIPIVIINLFSRQKIHSLTHQIANT